MQKLYIKLKLIINRFFNVQKLKKVPLIAALNQKMQKREAAAKLENLHRKGLSVLEKIAEVSGKCRQELFLNYGTLLGIYRDNAFIAHDDDMDLGYLFRSQEDFDALHKALEAHGFTLFRKFTYEDKIIEVTYICMGVNLDIFFYYPKDNTDYTVYLHERGEQTKAKTAQNTLCLEGLELFEGTYKIEGIAPWQFQNVPVNIPSNTEDYLEELYTKGWKSPDPSFVADKENTLKNLGFVESAGGCIYS